MENKNLDNEFFIQSDLLREVEPWMVKYFDYKDIMLDDRIEIAIKSQCKLTDYWSYGDDIDYIKHFYKTEGLKLWDESYTHQNGIDKASTYKDLWDEFPHYFNKIAIEKTKDAEELKELYLIYVTLSYMSYIYFRQKNDDFNLGTNSLAQDADCKSSA